MNDKEILKKLFKIAKNQQKVLEKLAQEKPGFPNSNDVKSYLERAVSVVIANAGISSSYHIDMNENPGKLDPSGISSASNYIIHLKFQEPIADNNIKAKLTQNLFRYVSNNRPELDGRVSLLFA